MCSCNKEKMKKALDSVTQFQDVSQFYCDKDGNKIFFVAGFGNRGPIPGECDTCIDKLFVKTKALCLPTG